LEKWKNSRSPRWNKVWTSAWVLKLSSERSIWSENSQRDDEEEQTPLVIRDVAVPSQIKSEAEPDEIQEGEQLHGNGMPAVKEDTSGDETNGTITIPEYLVNGDCEIKFSITLNHHDGSKIHLYGMESGTHACSQIFNGLLIESLALVTKRTLLSFNFFKIDESICFIGLIQVLESKSVEVQVLFDNQETSITDLTSQGRPFSH
jgi:hypothetical protein